MRIQGPAHLHNAQPISGPHRASAPAAAEPKGYAQPTDELSLSTEGAAISRLNESPEIRANRVAQIRSEIAAGSYETDAKLATALSRLLDEIG